MAEELARLEAQDGVVCEASRAALAELQSTLVTLQRTQQTHSQSTTTQTTVPPDGGPHLNQDLVHLAQTLRQVEADLDATQSTLNTTRDPEATRLVASVLQTRDSTRDDRTRSHPS